MGRNSNKSVKRRPKTKRPKAQSLRDYMSEHGIASGTDRVSYGVIKGYHGGGGKCTVSVILASGVTEVIKARLKGSYEPGKLCQRLYPGAFVLVDDGTIVLVYNESDYGFIDNGSLSKLIKERDGEDKDDCINISDDDSDEEDVVGVSDHAYNYAESDEIGIDDI